MFDFSKITVNLFQSRKQYEILKTWREGLLISSVKKLTNLVNFLVWRGQGNWGISLHQSSHSEWQWAAGIKNLFSLCHSCFGGLFLSLSLYTLSYSRHLSFLSFFICSYTSCFSFFLSLTFSHTHSNAYVWTADVHISHNTYFRQCKRVNERKRQLHG